MRFRQHHLVGGHTVFAHRDLFQIEPHTKAALVAHFDRRACEPRGPHILNGDNRTCRHEFETGFHQALFCKGIAHLHRRALFLDRVVKLGRGHGCPAHAVPARFCAKVDDGHPHTGGGRIENLISLGEASGECVHKTIAIIGRIKAHFAPGARHTETIAITADALDHAIHEAFRLGMGTISPKLSAFIEAMGRAPMVKTSRKMPPTPVAAP